MPTHSSTLAWQIPWMEKPCRLQSMGSRRVRHNYATSLSLFTLMHWRRKWQPTPVFLPGESPRRSLVGYRPRDHKELDTTEGLITEHNHGQHSSQVFIFLFIKTSFFRAVLDSQQNWGNTEIFLCIPGPDTCIASPLLMFTTRIMHF